MRKHNSFSPEAIFVCCEIAFETQKFRIWWPYCYWRTLRVGGARHSYVMMFLFRSELGAVPWAHGADAWVHIPRFISNSRSKERKGFDRVFGAISCLELRVSSLRWFLVFVTQFFHLVIAIIEISWSRKEIWEKDRNRFTLFSCNSLRVSL
jgi:hypothetical protein